MSTENFPFSKKRSEYVRVYAETYSVESKFKRSCFMTDNSHKRIEIQKLLVCFI